MTGTDKKIFRAGETLMQEGQTGDCAYVIDSGTVEILVQRENQTIQIGTRGAGSIIGEMAMIDDKPRTATIRALEDCTVISISREDFSRRVDSADAIVKMIMHVVMARYRDLMGRTQFINFPPSQLLEGQEQSENIHDTALSAIKINNELKSALAKDELTLFYQPIIDLQNIKIAGFEALMRWRHPEKGLIAPGIFIPIAEESGFITEMSRWALGVSCDAIRALTAAASPALVTKSPPFMSVNFSVKDFSDGNFFDHVRDTLTRHATPPEQIHLEITESLLMETPEKSKDALEKCRAHGVKVSIDDFGSGYSSLSYLHYFPITTLKIDQSFIRAMSTHEASFVLVKSIIALARNLNMKVIAEGIETAEEAGIVRSLGCEECQGYWFARPMPLEEAKKFVAEWQPPAIP